MKFNIDDYKGKYAMHCNTEEEARDFCRFLDSIGRFWSADTSYAEATYYDTYGNRTCYDFNASKYSGISWYVAENYKILEWSDFMNKKFTKSDLRSGDVVLRRDGRTQIVCKETDTLISPNGYDLLEEISEEFKYRKNCTTNISKYDIIAVRRPTAPHECQFKAFDKKYGDLVYEEVEEMTLEEVCKALGKEIKIVKR